MDVQAEVYDCGCGGDGGYGGAVCEIGDEVGVGIEALGVGCYEGGAVWPVGICVGGVIDGEDDVDVAVGLGEGVKGDVFEIFASVYEGEAAFLRDLGGGVV